MAHNPSVEELRTMTDELMLESGHQRGTPAWTENWPQYRDDLLNAQTNRIYWAENPDAPLTIAPENPAHDPFQKSWWSIHEQILGNTPPPLDQGSFAVDLSTVDFGVKQWIAAWQTMLGEMYSHFEEWSNRAIDEVIEAYNAGTLVANSPWTGTVAEFALRKAPYGIQAWTSTTMREDGSVVTTVETSPELSTIEDVPL